MTSPRQIAANRRNALKSTGPKTEAGKMRSSRNAIRHGLTSETVIEPLEDPEDYKALEQAVISTYEAETAVERELCLRVASLLWRLRRATCIETGLFEIHGEELVTDDMHRTYAPVVVQLGQADKVLYPKQGTVFKLSDDAPLHDENRHPGTSRSEACELSRRFVRLANVEHGAFERLGRYEAALWRQLRQLLFVLDALRPLTSGQRYFRMRGAWRTRA